MKHILIFLLISVSKVKLNFASDLNYDSWLQVLCSEHPTVSSEVPRRGDWTAGLWPLPAHNCRQRSASPAPFGALHRVVVQTHTQETHRSGWKDTGRLHGWTDEILHARKGETTVVTGQRSHEDQQQRKTMPHSEPSRCLHSNTNSMTSRDSDVNILAPLLTWTPSSRLSGQPLEATVPGADSFEGRRLQKEGLTFRLARGKRHGPPEFWWKAIPQPRASKSPTDFCGSESRTRR